MSNQVNVDFVTRQIEVDTDGKEHFISAAMAAKDAETAAVNAQNAANAAEAVAPEYAKTKAVLDNIVSYTNTATEQANIATTKATIAANSATNAAQSYANADAIATQLTEYLATKETLTAPAVDKTLLIEGAAADAKIVGELNNNNVERLNWLDNNEGKMHLVDSSLILDFEDGQILSSEVGATLEFGTYNWIKHYHVDVEEGQKYKVTIRKDESTRYNVAFTDSNNVIIGLKSKSVGKLMIVSETLVVPKGATRMYVSSQTGSPPQNEMNGLAIYEPRINDIERDLSKLKIQIEGEETLAKYGEFVRGNIEGLGNFENVRYRVCLPTITHIDRNLTLTAKEGYRFSIHFFENGVRAGGTDWETVYTIPNNSDIKIVIAETTEHYNTDADIDTFVNACTFKSDMAQSVEDIKQEVKEAKQDIASLTARLDDISADNLPNYWRTYLGTKIDEIKTNSTECAYVGDSFIFFTDYHIEQNSGYSHMLMKEIVKKTTINDVIFGGDIYNGTSTRIGTLAKANTFIERFAPLGIYGTRGNHEYNWNDGGSESEEMTENDIYNELLKKAEMSVITNGAMSFYKDNTNRKIRYIFVDSHYERDTSNEKTQIPQSELDWFKERMTELSSEWTIVVFTHNIYDMTYVNLDTPHYSANGRRIVDTVTVAKQTMNAKFACIICGHCHFDYSNTDNGFLIITVTCDSKQDSGQWIDWGAGGGTINEHAFDVFSIDTSNKTIKTVRIGRGNNRNWYY